MSSFDSNGNYNKTNWKTGDKITADKLNKIEESLEIINNNDIERHKEADGRLDELEQNEKVIEEELNNKATKEHTHDEYLTEHQDISNLATKEELNQGKTDMEDMVAEVDASMKAQVAEVEADLEGLHAKDEELSTQLVDKVNKGDLSYFNVKFLGAKGDGITDDTLVLQQVFETYDNIYIPEGDYIFNDTITCVGTKKKNIIQHGTLKYNGNGVAINIRTDFKNPADWQGLKLEGAEQGIGILVSAGGGWGRNLYLKNFFIKDFSENIRIESGYNITLENGISQTRHIPLFIGVNDGSKIGNTSFSNILTFNHIYFGGYSDEDKCYSCMVSTCCFDVNMNSCTFEYGDFAICGFSSAYPFNDGATGNPKVNYNNCWFEGLTTLYANYCDKYSDYNNYHVCSYNSLNIYNAFYERITNKYSFKNIYNNSILTNTMFPENQNIREISTDATSLKSMYNQTTLYNYNRTQGIINGKMQLIECYSNKGRKYILPNNIGSVYTGDSTLGTSIDITSLNSIASNEKTGLKHILKVYVYATDFNGKYAFKEYKFFEKKENEYVLYGESNVIYDGDKDPIFHIEFTNINNVVRLNATLTETSIYPKLELNVETVPISSFTI